MLQSILGLNSIINCYSDSSLPAGLVAQEVGCDACTVAETARSLLQGAGAMLSIGQVFPIVEIEASLLSASPDNLPILGPTEAHRLILTNAHYRSGNLLAPITAQGVKLLVLTGEVVNDLQLYPASRFAC